MPNTLKVCNIVMKNPASVIVLQYNYCQTTYEPILHL